MEEPILPELYWCPTSESDYSDTENGRNCMLRKSEKKVRIAALSLLLYVVRVCSDHGVFYFLIYRCTL